MWYCRLFVGIVSGVGHVFGFCVFVRFVFGFLGLLLRLGIGS